MDYGLFCSAQQFPGLLLLVVLTFSHHALAPREGERERERATPGSILPKKPFPPEIESHLRRPDADPTLKETVCAIAKKREGNLEVAQVKTIGDGVGSGSSPSSPLFRYCHSVQKRQLHAMSFCFFFASSGSHLL